MNQTLTLILGFGLPFLMTTLGSALILFFNKPSKIINTLAIGLASGIMISASIFSLLLPSINEAKSQNSTLFILPVALGFVLGGIFMIFLDFLCSKCLKFDTTNSKNKQKAFKLFTAITIHNIPEGLSVGFAIGSAIATQSPLLTSAIFAIGIAVQNFPEGLATALPLQNCLKNRKKSFFLSVLSGIVEPIFAIVGYFLATHLTNLLPWLLSFSAGTMIYVIIQELLPEIHSEENSYFGTWAFFVGFVLMMLLDLCL